MSARHVFEPGRPVHWTDLNADIPLARAITTFLAGDTLTKLQIESFRRYAMQWANAPYWDSEPMHSEDRELLNLLRMRAVIIASTEDCKVWRDDAVNLGMNPF